jgi:hypothetical protein
MYHSVTVTNLEECVVSVKASIYQLFNICVDTVDSSVTFYTHYGITYLPPNCKQTLTWQGDGV